MDDSCLIFRSPPRPLLAISAIILYGDGLMDEYLRYDIDCLSFSELSRYVVNRMWASKDMPTDGNQDVISACQPTYRAVMAYR